MSSPASTFHPSPSAPRLKLPRGACDTHVHVFGPVSRFAFAPERSFTPGDAPKETLFALHAKLGIDHCVVVQSMCHGYDNAATEDAIAARAGAYRGVALVRVDVTDAELRRLDAAGFRAARFNFMRHLGSDASIDQVVRFAHRLAGIGWHLQVHFESALVHELAPKLAQSPVPVVIDHMGRVDASLGIGQPDFARLRALLESAKFWVKVSGCDRSTRLGPPYDDAVPLAALLVAEAGDRVLWGTDWPHPNHAGPVPDDGMLVDLIERIAPTEAARQALLVDNPQRLYQFDGAARE